MRLYWPEPNPPCKPKECIECETLIDGDEIEGYWLERENHQDYNTYHLFCLDCCTEKMDGWSNYPNVPDVETAKEVLYK